MPGNVKEEDKGEEVLEPEITPPCPTDEIKKSPSLPSSTPSSAFSFPMSSTPFPSNMLPKLSMPPSTNSFPILSTPYSAQSSPTSSSVFSFDSSMELEPIPTRKVEDCPQLPQQSLNWPPHPPVWTKSPYTQSIMERRGVNLNLKVEVPTIKTRPIFSRNWRTRAPFGEDPLSPLNMLLTPIAMPPTPDLVLAIMPNKRQRVASPDLPKAPPPSPETPDTVPSESKSPDVFVYPTKNQLMARTLDLHLQVMLDERELESYKDNEAAEVEAALLDGGSLVWLRCNEEDDEFMQRLDD